MKKVISTSVVTILSVVALALTGCSTAGPFVTSISSDGQGNLVIEKGYIKYNGWTGTISDEGGSTTTIKLK